MDNLYKFSSIYVSAELINILWVESVHIEQNLQFVPQPDDDDRSEDGDEAEGDQGEDAEDLQGLRPRHHDLFSLGTGAGEVQLTEVLPTGGAAS